VGGEHVMLGVIGEPDSLAARAVEAQGVSLDAARQTLTTTAGRGAGSAPDHIPYSAEAKKIRELALREALRLGRAQVGTDDILLAVLRDRRGAAARALTALGIRRDRTEKCLRELAHGESPRE
jgi:ATP-dependent Clp protease ATP-binding subunit ClpA